MNIQISNIDKLDYVWLEKIKLAIKHFSTILDNVPELKHIDYIVAGGSITNYFLNIEDKESDIDIYFEYKDYKPIIKTDDFNEFFKSNSAKSSSKCCASAKWEEDLEITLII